MMGQHDKALRMARQVLNVEKDDPDALYLAGCTHFQRGESHAAMKYLQAFSTGPEIEVALEVEGMLKVLRGQATPPEGEPDDDSAPSESGMQLSRRPTGARAVLAATEAQRALRKTGSRR